MWLVPIAPRIHITGAKTNIRRTLNMISFKDTSKDLKWLSVYHNSGEIHACHSIKDNEHIVVINFVETDVQSDYTSWRVENIEMISFNKDLTRKHEHKHMKIEIEGRPSCGLMFRHGCNNWDVVFSITRIKKWVETTSPWSNFSWGQNISDMIENGNSNLKK